METIFVQSLYEWLMRNKWVFSNMGIDILTIGILFFKEKHDMSIFHIYALKGLFSYKMLFFFVCKVMCIYFFSLRKFWWLELYFHNSEIHLLIHDKRKHDLLCKHDVGCISIFIYISYLCIERLIFLQDVVVFCTGSDYKVIYFF